MALTVKEKEHWKTSIERKIQRTIDEIYKQGTPNLRSRIESESKNKAVESLGISELYRRREAIKTSMLELEDERRSLDNHITHKLTTDWPEFKDVPFYVLIDQAITRRQEGCRRDLLAQDPQGRKILRLELEREELLDTVWLATSPSQIKVLWSRVSQMLDQPLTDLQQEALAIPSDSPQTE